MEQRRHRRRAETRATSARAASADGTQRTPAKWRLQSTHWSSWSDRAVAVAAAPGQRCLARDAATQRAARHRLTSHAAAREERLKTRQGKEVSVSCWAIFAHMSVRMHTEHRFECCRGRTSSVWTCGHRSLRRWQWHDSRRCRCRCRRQSWRSGASVGGRRIRCARICSGQSSCWFGGRWRWRCAVGHLCPGYSRQPGQKSERQICTGGLFFLILKKIAP